MTNYPNHRAKQVTDVRRVNYMPGLFHFDEVGTDLDFAHLCIGYPFVRAATLLAAIVQLQAVKLLKGVTRFFRCLLSCMWRS
jgi:hypothetical protein